jgi:hypothetical protein
MAPMRAMPLILIAACCPPAPPAKPIAPASTDLATVGAPGLTALDVKALEATTKYLASDELQGRGTGSEGGAKAEQYIADRFKELGLEPAGESDTYFQTVPFRESTRVDEGSSLVIHASTGDIAISSEHALIRPDPRDTNVSIDAPLVFVGYGISRPELGYDDLAGVDLNGAIAVVYGGSPRSLDGKEIDPALHAVLADVALRTPALKARGARAVISIYDPVRATRMPFALYITKLVGSSLNYLENGQPASNPALPYAVLDELALDQILAPLPNAPRAHTLWERIDRGEHISMLPLGNASLRIKSTHRDITARNVVGLLRGETDETLVYSAHLDHLGIGPAIDGDTIYNGALDNAIGCAALLEMARAFKALPNKPRRSVLFVAVTAEEKGLLGSEYFTNHPTVPLPKMVANINIDGITPNWDVHDVVALGSEHSSIAEHVAAAAKIVGVSVSPDPDPPQVYFIRSDQYNFVKKGIPAIFPGAGFRDANGNETNRPISDAWGEQHYHRPSDQWRPEYRAEWALPELKFDFLVGLSIANAPTNPQWNAGDVFGKFAGSPSVNPAK